MQLLSLIIISTIFSCAFCQVARFGYTKRHNEAIVRPTNLEKRDQNYKSINFIDDTIAYYVNLTVGSQGEQIMALIDTGSSDLWIPGPDNSKCSNGEPIGSRFIDTPDITASILSPKASEIVELADEIQNFCSEPNFFNYHKSQTWHSNDTLFKISYLDGSSSTGLWGTDEVKVSGINLSNFSFAVTNSSNAAAILGISFEKSETTHNMNDKTPYTYSNFPMRLKQDGYISKITYSLCSGKSGEYDGTLLVGGVDHSKYNGNLTTVPMVSNSMTAITLNGLGLKINDSIETMSSTLYESLLDSGTTTANFPHQLLNPLATRLGSNLKIVNRDSYEYYDVDCSYLGQENFTFELDFSGKVISVPLSNAIGKQNDTCYLKIVSLTDDLIILGDIFLSSMYTVYDLENQEISIAQINHDNNSNESIEPIISTIPSATRAPNYSSTFSSHASESTTFDVFSTVIIT